MRVPSPSSISEVLGTRASGGFFAEETGEHPAVALRRAPGAVVAKARRREDFLPRFLILGLWSEVFEILRNGFGADAPLQHGQHFDRPCDFAEQGIDEITGTKRPRGLDALAIDADVACDACPRR